jgi:hypothetical protein
MVQPDPAIDNSRWCRYLAAKENRTLVNPVIQFTK